MTEEAMTPGMRRVMDWLCCLWLGAAGLMFCGMAVAILGGHGCWSLVKKLNDGAGNLLTAAVGLFALGYAIREYRIRNFPQISLHFEGMYWETEYRIRIVAKNENPYPASIVVKKLCVDGKDVTPQSMRHILLKDGDAVLHSITGTGVIGQAVENEVQIVCLVESVAPPYHCGNLSLEAKLESSPDLRSSLVDVSEYRLTPLSRQRGGV